MTRPASEPARYAGPALVATWLGVSRAALGNWLRRYDDIPEVAAVITGPKRDSWCWRLEQREDWIRWAAGKDVAGGYVRARDEAGCPRPRRRLPASNSNSQPN